MYSYSIFYYLATCGPKGHVRGSIHFSVFNHIPSPTTGESSWGSISVKKGDKRKNKRKRKIQTKQAVRSPSAPYSSNSSEADSNPSLTAILSVSGRSGSCPREGPRDPTHAVGTAISHHAVPVMPTPLGGIGLLVPALLVPTNEVCVRWAVVSRIERRRVKSKEGWKLHCSHYIPRTQVWVGHVAIGRDSTKRFAHGLSVCFVFNQLFLMCYTKATRSVVQGCNV